LLFKGNPLLMTTPSKDSIDLDQNLLSPRNPKMLAVSLLLKY